MASPIRHSNIMAVTGMTGVGKDYLVERANRTRGVAVENFGTHMGEELEIDRDLIVGAITQEQLSAAQERVARKLARIQPLILCSHVVIHDSRTGEYAFNINVERILDPRNYVFVTAPPEVIQERVEARNRSGERSSELLSIDQIDDAQQTKLGLVESIAEELGSDLTVMHNTTEELSANLASFGQLIDGLVGKQ